MSLRRMAVFTVTIMTSLNALLPPSLRRHSASHHSPASRIIVTISPRVVSS